MNCTFFGHRDVTCEVKELLKSAILDLIDKEHINNFLVGNNGNFDFYVQCTLAELKKEGVDISFAIVLSHLGKKLCQVTKATQFFQRN